MRRRDFLRLSAGAALWALAGSSLFARRLLAAPGSAGPGPYGPLLAADANGLELPAGFTSRIVAAGGQTVAGTSYTWHDDADGGAVFPVPGGYIYVSNAERSAGGVSAIRFDYRGGILDAYSICSGTNRNCAGGATPWGTWLTCEEVGLGAVVECDPTGASAQVERPALGYFKHEAVCVDPARRRLYLTEDRSDSCLYRFTPTSWGDLSSGLLEAARVSGSDVTWAAVPDPNPGSGDTATRYQVAGVARFGRGEGIDYRDGHVYFAATSEHRIYDLDVVNDTLSVHYDRASDPGSQLGSPDNVVVSRAHDVFGAEDGDNRELVLLSPDCVASPFLRLAGYPGSEVTGPAFAPLGRRLYVSSQRGGPASGGATFEITGPFRRVPPV